MKSQILAVHKTCNAFICFFFIYFCVFKENNEQCNILDFHILAFLAKIISRLNNLIKINLLNNTNEMAADFYG